MPDRAVPACSGGPDTFDQAQAKGFVQLFSLPAKIAAARDAKRG